MSIEACSSIPRPDICIRWLDVDLLAHYNILLSRHCTKKAVKESILEALEKEYEKTHSLDNIGLVRLYSILYCNCVVMGLIKLQIGLINIQQYANISGYESDRLLLICDIHVYYKQIKEFIGNL